MKWFTDLRSAAMLRRIAKALEAANELERERMSLEFEEYRRKIKPKARNPRMTEVSHPTNREWNERWDKKQEAERDEEA